MVGGSLRVLRLLPPLKLVAMKAEILLKVALNTKNQSINQSFKTKDDVTYGSLHLVTYTQHKNYIFISFDAVTFKSLIRM